MMAVWERFWFKPQSTATLAVVRIIFGLVSLAWTISVAPDLDAFFGRGGLLAKQPGGRGVWGVLGLFPGDAAVQILFAVLLVSSVALIVGYHTRLAAALVFVAMLSFDRRNPFVTNAGDGLVRTMAFYLMLAPAGAALSVDRWRHARDRFWEFPLRAPWALRLMQVQLCFIYVTGLWIKVQGTTWNNGTAVSYAMRLGDVSRFSPPSFITHSLFLSNLMTFGTLVVELSIPILVWIPRMRKWVLLVGVLLHVGIGITIRVGFFSIAMLTLYLSFLDPSWAEAKILSLRAAWLERRRAPAGAPPRARDPVPGQLAATEERPDGSEGLPLPEH
jgi:hypothetical protein